MTPYWHDFKIVQLTESQSSRLDGTEPSAHTTTKFQKKIIYMCAPQKSVTGVKIVLNSQGRTARWNNVKTTPKPSESKSDCTKSLEKEGQKSIPANKYGKEGINRSQDSVKEPNELTRKLDGDGIVLLLHQAHMSVLTVGTKCQWWLVSWYVRRKVVSPCSRDSLVAWRALPMLLCGCSCRNCEHYTKPTHT